MTENHAEHHAENHGPDEQGRLRVTHSVQRRLLHIGGLTIFLAGVACITGWLETSAFHRELGAPWATSLLTPTQVMQASDWLIALTSSLAFIIALVLAEKTAEQTGLRRWSTLFLVLAIIVHILSLVLEDHVGLITTSLMLEATTLCWALAAGVLSGDLVTSLTRQEFKWSQYETFLLYFVVLHALSQATTAMGESRAKLAGHPALTSLPNVTLVGAASGSWRLVGACGDKLLLVSLAPDRKGRLFKLVSTESISEIGAARTVNR